MNGWDVLGLLCGGIALQGIVSTICDTVSARRSDRRAAAEREAAACIAEAFGNREIADAIRRGVAP